MGLGPSPGSRKVVWMNESAQTKREHSPRVVCGAPLPGFALPPTSGFGTAEKPADPTTLSRSPVTGPATQALPFRGD